MAASLSLLSLELPLVLWMEEEEGGPLRASMLNSHTPCLAGQHAPILICNGSMDRWKVKMNLKRTLNRTPKNL